MSATYNWAYRPGVANKYGLTINTSADNVRPSNACYVALFGNDTTGNGSRLYPYKTLTKALSSGSSNIIIGSGVYREVDIYSGSIGLNMIGDGDVVIDFAYNGLFCNGTLSGGSICNITLVGNGINSYFGILLAYGTALKDVILLGCYFAPSHQASVITGCIISNFFGTVNIIGGSTPTNTTFVNCNNIYVSNGSGNIISCIFSHCNISFDGVLLNNGIRYSLFNACNFKLNGIGSGGVVHPSTPAGYTYHSTISSLNSAYIVLNGVSSFTNCTIADPLFNNEQIGDYTLAFNSPAKNLSYFGTFVGARSIAQSLKIRAVEVDGDFDFSSAVNVTITDNSLILTDPTLDAVIETKVIENTFGRQLKSIPIVGFNADRNGQYIDSISDLATVTKVAGDALAIPSSYIVEAGSITYNGALYTAGQRFTTVTGQSTFSSITGGVLREILEAPQRHTIEIKLSDVQPFTTEAFNHFEPGIAPTTNNVGDSRVGTILRGNGDPAYMRGATVEFPVSSKYIKVRFTIRANNLKP